jgi:hypothetical protein
VSHSDSPRGGQWLAKGGDSIADNYDRDRQAAPVETERDWCGRLGALELGRKIEAYWRERGRTVTCRTEPSGFGVIAVRSDLLGGLPR